jgi:rRNA maturation endonuclease Nob1
MEKIQRTCLGCKRLLPEGYKHLFCESCRTKQVENVKKVAKAVMGATAAVTVLVAAVRTRPKD